MTIRFAVLAMVGGTLWERIALDPVRFALSFGTIFVPLLLVIMAYRRYPLEVPYFSGLFTLALCPILFIAFVSVMDLHHLIEHEDLTPDYVVQRLQGFLQTAVFSFVWSALGVSIYTSFYLLSRRYRRNA